MTRVALLLVAASILTSTLPSAAAQEAADVPDGLLYFTNKVLAEGGVSGTTVGTKIFEATTVEPTASASQKAYANVAAVGVGYATAFRWTLDQPMTLTGEVLLYTWVSCDVAAVFRPDPTGSSLITIGGVLQKNGATIAGSAKNIYDATPVACTGPTSIRPVTLAMPLAETEFKVGDTFGASLSMWLAVNGQESQHKNVHFLVGSSSHPSRLAVPGLGAGATAQGVNRTYLHADQTLNGSSAEIRESFPNTTNAVHNYTWATTESSFVVSTSTKISNGSLYFEMFDGKGVRAYNGTRTSANNSAGEEFVPPVLIEGAPGDWKIQVTFTDFVGDASFTIGVAPKTASSVSTTNETAAPKTEGGDSPAAPFMLGVLMVAVAAVLVRRRR